MNASVDSIIVELERRLADRLAKDQGPLSNAIASRFALSRPLDVKYKEYKTMNAEDRERAAKALVGLQVSVLADKKLFGTLTEEGGRRVLDWLREKGFKVVRDV